MHIDLKEQQRINSKIGIREKSAIKQSEKKLIGIICLVRFENKGLHII